MTFTYLKSFARTNCGQIGKLLMDFPLKWNANSWASMQIFRLATVEANPLLILRLLCYFPLRNHQSKSLSRWTNSQGGCVKMFPFPGKRVENVFFEKYVACSACDARNSFYQPEEIINIYGNHLGRVSTRSQRKKNKQRHGVKKLSNPKRYLR